MVFKQGVSWGEQILGDTDRSRLLLGNSHVLIKYVRTTAKVRDPCPERAKPRHQTPEG